MPATHSSSSVGTTSQATSAQSPDDDTEMADASAGEPGSDSNGLNLQKGSDLQSATALDIENGGKYHQYYGNDGKSLTGEM
jgi:hypothetical protein